jgi:hypothetical protein
MWIACSGWIWKIYLVPIHKNSIDLSSCKIKRKKKEKEDGKVYKFSLYTKTDIRCPRTTGPACAEVSLIIRT